MSVIALPDRSDGARRVLDVWGAYQWADRMHAECPTFAAVWDPHVSDGHVWVHEQTGELVPAIECPRGPYRLAEMWVSPRAGALHFGIQPGPRWRRMDEVDRRAMSTRRLENPVRTVALAVDSLMIADRWPDVWRAILLDVYPRSGLYERPPRAWTSSRGGQMERATGRVLNLAERRAIALICGHQLRVGMAA